MEKDTRTAAEIAYDATRLSPLPALEGEARYAALDEAEARVLQALGPGLSNAELLELAGRVDAAIAADRALANGGCVDFTAGGASVGVEGDALIYLAIFGTIFDTNTDARRQQIRDLYTLLSDRRVQQWLHAPTGAPVEARIMSERYEPWADILDPTKRGR